MNCCGFTAAHFIAVAIKAVQRSDGPQNSIDRRACCATNRMKVAFTGEAIRLLIQIAAQHEPGSGSRGRGAGPQRRSSAHPQVSSKPTQHRPTTPVSGFRPDSSEPRTHSLARRSSGSPRSPPVPPRACARSAGNARASRCFASVILPHRRSQEPSSSAKKGFTPIAPDLSLLLVAVCNLAKGSAARSRIP